MNKKLVLYATLILLLIVLAFVIRTLIFPPKPVKRKVTELIVPATLIVHTELPAKLPADLALAEGRLFVLDTGNGRILELSTDAELLSIINMSAQGISLVGAMSITAHEGKLYVANSLQGQVVVLTTQGELIHKIQLENAPGDEKRPRPVGIAVTDQGEIIVGDPDNHRVLRYGLDGKLLSFIGTGERDSGEYGFNSPGYITLDKDGNIYVLDMLNYCVKKYSPDGKFMLKVGKAGDTAGTFSRPKGVAVDSAGRIYVSDGLLVAVEVFQQNGTYIGFIGRKEPTKKESTNIFQLPHGLKVQDDKLYVVDRFAGLFVFQLAK